MVATATDGSINNPLPQGIAPEAWAAIGAKREDDRWAIPERDASGEIIGWSLRPDQGKKYFKTGGHRGLTLKWPLHSYAGSAASNPVFVVEGASDTAAGIMLGLDIVGRPSATGGVDHLIELLRGLHVCIIAENDKAGQDGAQRVAEALVPHAASVRIIQPPSEHKDLRAWLIGGVTRTDIFILSDTAPPVSVSSVSAPGGALPENWPVPQPLPHELPPVLPFDPIMLPDSLRPWVTDIAERIQCPIDYVAVAAMVALSALIGRKVGIRPKGFDDWTVVPNLWGAVIGRPGVMKSPAIQEPLKPQRRFEAEAKAEYDEQVKDRAAAEMVGEAKKKDAKGRIKKNLANPDEAKRLARESLDTEVDGELARKRYIVNSTTVEKLGEILSQNPHGVLIFRDELIGFLKSLEKDGQESSRAFYLEAWNGNGSFAHDTIGRGTIDIEAATVAILGGIQPGPLSQYLRAAARGGDGDDGFIQRFQLLVWPDVSKEWKNVDRWPDSEARKAANAVFEGMRDLDSQIVGADVDPNDPGGIPFLRFTEEALAVFVAWRTQLERLLRSGTLHPVLEAHFSKYRKLIPSLALIIHLAGGGQGPVGIDALDKALRWDAYLDSHARRVYSQAIEPGVAAARSLASHILAGDVKDGFTLRHVYRKGWTAIGCAEDAKEAVELLIDLDWMREETKITDGRPGKVYVINPLLADSEAAKSISPSSKGTDRTDGSPASPTSVGSVGSPEGTNGEMQPPEGAR